MKYLLSTFVFLLFSVTSFAEPINHDIFVCTSKVAGNSHFSCITPAQADKYTAYFEDDDDQCSRAVGFTVRITNIGIHSFRLHPHGEDIKPGESTESLHVLVGLKKDHWDIQRYDDGHVSLYRSDSLLSNRTLTARVEVDYTKGDCYFARGQA